MSRKKEIKQLKKRVKVLESIMLDLIVPKTEPKTETLTTEVHTSLSDLMEVVEATPKKNGMVYFFPDGDIFTTDDEVTTRLLVQILDAENDEDFEVVLAAIRLESDVLSAHLSDMLYDIFEIEYSMYLREKGII